MKKILFLLISSLSVFLLFNQSAQATVTFGKFSYAKDFGGSSAVSADDEAADMVFDSSGNAYVVGQINGASIDFDRQNIVAGDTKSSNGNDDIFIAKYDNSGVLIWVKVIGGAGNDLANTISIDSNGDIIVGGSFTQTVDFDPDNVVAGDTIAGAATTQMFFAKYNSSGVLQWVRVASGGVSFIRAMDTDSSNNICVVGEISSSTVDLNPGSVVSGDSHTSNGFGDVFIAKYDTNGTYIWSKAFGGTNSENAWSVACDSTSFVAQGYFYSANVDFDRDNSSPGDTISANNTDNTDIYLVRYTANGAFSWVKGIGDSGYEYGRGVALDSLSNVYATGSYSGIGIDFDEDNSVAGDTTTASIFTDVYLAKYNTTGVLIWLKTLVGNNNDSGRDLAITSNDLVILGGDYAGSIDLDPSGVSYNDLRPDTTGTDYFIAGYDSNGNYQFGQSIYGTSTVGTFIGLTENFGYLGINGKLFTSSSIFFDQFSATSYPVTLNGAADNLFMTYQISTAGRIINLPGGLQAEDILTSADATVNNAIFGSTSSRSILISNASDEPIASVNTDLTDDRDWGSSSITADNDLVEGKSFIHNLTAAPGTAGNFTLYIPKLSGHNGVMICPGADSLVDVTSSCPGGFTINEADNSISEENIGGQDYWVVSGLENTGGQSMAGTVLSIGPSMRVVLRDSENTNTESDVEVWFDAAASLPGNTIIYISYEAGSGGFTGGT